MTPLAGIAVLVTRPADQAAALAQRLTELGAEVALFPVIAIGPPSDWADADRAIRRLRDFDWLVFTSANGVRGFFGRLRTVGDAATIGSVAAIGPGTARALAEVGVTPRLVSKASHSEALAAELVPLVGGQRVLLPRGEDGRDVLRQLLGRVAEVTAVAVYRQVEAADELAEAWGLLRSGSVRYVTVTSPNIARRLLTRFDPALRARVRRDELRLVSISPFTSAAIHELGLPVAVEAVHANDEGLVAAILTDAAR